MKKAMIILIVIAIIIAVFIILDGSFLPKKYLGKWDDKGIVEDQYSLSKIINYAIGAPSSHNMQPWLVKIVDSSKLELYADMDKQLSVVDKDNYQMLMSQGTFIQKFVQGAEEYGYAAKIEYSEIDMNDSMPKIAEISIEKTNDFSMDTISSGTIAINKEAEAEDIGKLANEIIGEYEAFSYSYVSKSDDIEKLQKYLLEGTIAESRDEEATQELLDVFRWTEWQKNKYRYGLSLNTLPGVLKPFIQPIMNLSSNNWQAFGESSIKIFEERLENETGYILIKKDNPGEIDYIYAGEIYQKLSQNANGYVLRPAMQVLEDFGAMHEIRKEFYSDYCTDGEVLIIIGIQPQEGKSTAGNPRHRLQDIIIE